MKKILKFITIMWIPSWFVFFLITNASQFPKWASWVLPDIFWCGTLIGIGVIAWKTFISKTMRLF